MKKTNSVYGNTGGNNVTIINVRIDKDAKKQADKVIADLGYTPSQVIRELYDYIRMNKELPWEVKLVPKKKKTT